MNNFLCQQLTKNILACAVTGALFRLESTPYSVPCATFARPSVASILHLKKPTMDPYADDGEPSHSDKSEWNFCEFVACLIIGGLAALIFFFFVLFYTYNPHP